MTWARERYLKERARRRKILKAGLFWILFIGGCLVASTILVEMVYRAMCIERGLIP